jgi:hypothetical protein
MALPSSKHSDSYTMVRLDVVHFLVSVSTHTHRIPQTYLNYSNWKAFLVTAEYNNIRLLGKHLKKMERRV